MRTKLSLEERRERRLKRLERIEYLRCLPYEEYLQSPEWRLKRAKTVRRAGYRCQVCNRRGPLHVHHRSYENLGRERTRDLVVLCDGCHRLFHENGRIATEP
jgi:5-methylcytosine-specific restriction endonuclease McrA